MIHQLLNKSRSVTLEMLEEILAVLPASVTEIVLATGTTRGAVTNQLRMLHSGNAVHIGKFVKTSRTTMAIYHAGAGVDAINPAKPGKLASPDEIAPAWASRNIHVMRDDTHYPIRIEKQVPAQRDPLVEALFGVAHRQQQATITTLLEAV